MGKHVRWRIGLLVGLTLLLVLTACDEVATETPSPVGPETNPVLSVPTRTLGPIVSFTPRFTATPIPSATFTPSTTPTPTLTGVPPTLTPTPSPTLTPTIAGVVRSTENVNLRAGPGTDFDIVASVAPGTEMGVLGVQTDDQDREWFNVVYIDDDEQPQLVWISATLIETDFVEIVGVNATAPPLPDVTFTPAPTVEPNRVDVLAYCQQKGVRPAHPTTNDNVYIEWSWFVAREEYMEEHLANANYDITLDGESLLDWEQYATDMKLEDGVHIIYWYYPIGNLTAGDHTIEFRLTWDEAINDGYARFGPGTANEVDEGTCTFTVVEP